ncbi:uncharacterized protein JCM10292_004112 [Rhodotorula paludigena]|uniref:uncharacterized protein n=1 Tax=Rhodotorula paludigena TaxID=86838 RepID=UPI00316B0A2C
MFAPSTSFLATAFAAFAAVCTVSAAKSPDGVFDPNSVGSAKVAYAPPFTSPSGGEVWIAGSSYSASWSQELPDGVQLSNVSQTANLVLGYETPDSTSLNLNWTLAEDIPLYAPNPNSVDFTLPDDLPTRDSYLLVLLGSTNDQSARFSIVGNIVPGTVPSSTPSLGHNDDSDSASDADADEGEGAAAGEGDDASNKPALLRALGLRKVRRSEAGKARLDN